MKKSILVTMAMLICVSALTLPAVARTTKATPERRQQVLVKRINQGALRVYKAYVRQYERTITIDCELNELFEDLLLAADDLTNSRHLRHKLLVVMQIASDIEQEFLATEISPEMIRAWSRLNADLDRLAKMQGVEWSEAVVPEQWIASVYESPSLRLYSDVLTGPLSYASVQTSI